MLDYGSLQLFNTLQHWSLLLAKTLSLLERLGQTKLDLLGRPNFKLRKTEPTF